MRHKIGLFAVYWSCGREQHLLTRILAKDSETAIRQARTLFKDKLSSMKGIELVSKTMPLNRVVLYAKDPAKGRGVI